jgi:DNA repair exonuclease SbcCD ATPase subunit
MRIKAIELAGFRAFSRRQMFDLDSDVVVLVGSNGQGKTSLFDGLLWAVTGLIPRLGKDSGGLVSMYSESGEARVALTLSSDSGETCTLVRSFDGQSQRFQLEVESKTPLREAAANLRLFEMLWPQALLTPDGLAALTAALTRSVYLQQDLVRQFIEADSETERFTAVSELVGTGRLTELQLQLEKSRTAWSRATNNQSLELDSSRRRLANLESQLADLSQVTEGDIQEVAEVWESWWQEASNWLSGTISETPSADSIEASRVLDTAVKQLGVLQHATARRSLQVSELLAEIRSYRPPVQTDEAVLEQLVTAADRELNAAREDLTNAQLRAAEERRHQVEAHDAREELRAFARLALRHLNESCPVCSQTYDQEATRRRLEAIASDEGGESLVSTTLDDVPEKARIVEEREQLKNDAELNLRRAQQAGREHRIWTADRDRRLSELGLGFQTEGFSEEALERSAQDLEDQAALLSSHQRQGESLALRLTQRGESARRTELEEEISRLRVELQNAIESVNSRKETGELANQILDSMRESSSDVVEHQLHQIEPILQRVYARIDPHPTFRAVRLLSKIVRGHGHLLTTIEDPLSEVSTHSPSTVLSSSQMNALAVAVFLSFNLGLPFLPLDTAILDDPLQSLDDVNLLGLVDLLRRVRSRRQLFVSTHDGRFGSLLARKLRPVLLGQRTRLIEMQGWGREGPVVTQTDVATDASPLRIAV